MRQPAFLDHSPAPAAPHTVVPELRPPGSAVTRVPASIIPASGVRPCVFRARSHSALLLAWAIAAAMVAGGPGLAWGQVLVSSTKSCTRCHFPAAGEIGIEAPAADKPSPFCAQEEAAAWEQTDKHRQSMFLLLNDGNRSLTNRILGFDIADVLSFKLEPRKFRPLNATADVSVDSVTAVEFRKEADAARRATVEQCLSCHSPISEPLPDDPTVSSLEFGVSCQACHGIGSGYFAAHQDGSRMWRLLEPGIKESQFGLRDLRHPRVRAELCASCHVGGMRDDWGPAAIKARRFVRHEWYAQGHPPLPGMEYVTFAAQMPAHWHTLREKAAAPKPFLFLNTPTADDQQKLAALRAAFHQQYLAPKGIDLASLKDSYLAANRGGLPSAELPVVLSDQPRGRDVLISGVTVLGRYASLLADCPPDDATDFALFDCGACHHELRNRFPSDARVRRRVTPGRPPAALWTLALGRLGTEHAAAVAPTPEASFGSVRTLSQWRDEFHASIEALDAALSARPFGDLEKRGAAARRLQAACDAIAQGLATSPFLEADAARLLAKLAHPRDGEERDYHTARQHAWAIREVVKDLAGVPHRNDAPGGARFVTPPARPVPARVLAALGAKTDAMVMSNDPRILERIDGLFGSDPWFGPLRLRLPAGQQETIVGNLADSLGAISRHDPAFFQERLKPLRDQYPLAPTDGQLSPIR
jgi:hypothetical protein